MDKIWIILFTVIPIYVGIVKISSNIEFNIFENQFVCLLIICDLLEKVRNTSRKERKKYQE